MTLEFLSPRCDGEATGGAPLAASPLEPWLTQAGARFEARHCWRMPMDFGAPAEEAEACRGGVGISDRSAIGKFELQGPPPALEASVEALLSGPTPGAGWTARLEGALLWRSSPDRALAVCEPVATQRLRALLKDAYAESRSCGVVELTAGLAAIELRGPRARELLERLTAIDVRERSLPPQAVRAGRLAEVPATLLCTEPQAFLVLAGAPEAPDAWEIMLDVGGPLGLRPVGEDARTVSARRPEAVAARA